MIRKSIAASHRKSTALSPHSPAENSPLIRVVFELPSCTWACHISVCGDFNDWKTDATPMRQDRDGVWRAVVELPANQRFQFRYLIDGHWQSDDHADGWEENSYGGTNSVVDTGMPVRRSEAQEGRSSVHTANLLAQLPEVRASVDRSVPAALPREAHGVGVQRPIRSRVAARTRVT